jgi:hypothetical protein
MERGAWFALLVLAAEGAGIVLADIKSDDRSVPGKADRDLCAIQKYIVENFGR